MVSIAIMGHGVVGSGVAEIFTTHKQKLYASIGEEVYVKKILDLREFPDSPLADRFTKNFEDIINDLEIRVVVEVMGGLNPAYDFVILPLISKVTMLAVRFVFLHLLHTESMFIPTLYIQRALQKLHLKM